MFKYDHEASGMQKCLSDVPWKTIGLPDKDKGSERKLKLDILSGSHEVEVVIIRSSNSI
jgi:hypothetical protein